MGVSTLVQTPRSGRQDCVNSKGPPDMDTLSKPALLKLYRAPWHVRAGNEIISADGVWIAQTPNAAQWVELANFADLHCPDLHDDATPF